MASNPLFIFKRITGAHPRTPAPLKGKHVTITVALKGLCHPGTCSFVISRAIKYQGLILGVFLTPLVHFCWILSDGRWNFFTAPPPVAMGTHVYDHRVRSAQQSFDLVNGHPGDFTVVVCQGNDCLAPHHQKDNIPPCASS